MSADLVVAFLGGFQRFQIVAIPGTLAGSLHLEQVLEGADADAETTDVNVARLSVEGGERRDLRQTLQYVDRTQLGRHQRTVAGPEEDRDGLSGEATIPNLDLSIQFTKQLGEPLQILRGGIGHYVDIVGSPHIPPSPYRQPTD